MSSERTVESLVGEEMNAVSFVMDYLEFHFNGPILRCIANPTLDYEGTKIRFPDTGSRDAFCSLIGKTVTDLQIKEDQWIRLTFDSGHVIRIPLDDEHRFSGEAAHFVPGIDKPIEVW